MTIKNVPNILSFIRLLLVPVYLIAFFLINQYVALGIFIVASITDLVDGYIARRYDAITEFGKVLDPFADKLMKTSALITLIFINLPIWVAVVMIACDLAMIISGMCLYKKQITIQSNWIGKLGTFVISVGIVLSFFVEWLGNVNLYVIYSGILIAIIAGLDYVYNFFTKKFKKNKNSNDELTQNSTNENLNKTANNDIVHNDKQETIIESDNTQNN